MAPAAVSVGAMVAVVLIVAMVWLYMSANAVKPDENGLVLRLGAYNRTAGPGLHFVLWPLEQMEKLSVEAENQINFARQGCGLDPRRRSEPVAIEFSVLWRIKDARDLLFNIADAEQLITRISESAMRRSSVALRQTRYERADAKLRKPKSETSFKGRLTSTSRAFSSAVCSLEKADPPTPVLSSFEEVQRALAEPEQADLRSRAISQPNPWPGPR